MSKIKIQEINSRDAVFTTASGRELKLTACETAIFARLEFNAEEASTVFIDGDDAVAESVELKRLLDAVSEGEKAKLRLLQIAAEHERRVLDYVAERDAEDDEVEA